MPRPASSRSCAGADICMASPVPQLRSNIRGYIHVDSTGQDSSSRRVAGHSDTSCVGQGSTTPTALSSIKTCTEPRARCGRVECLCWGCLPPPSAMLPPIVPSGMRVVYERVCVSTLCVCVCSLRRQLAPCISSASARPVQPLLASPCPGRGALRSRWQ